MAGRTLVLCLALVLSFYSHGSAANTTPVVIQLSPTALLSNVLEAFGATLIDSLADTNSYLISATVIPPASLYPSLGVEMVESNLGVNLSAGHQKGVLKVPAGAAADWYKNQPMFSLVHSQEALGMTRGQGVIIADINSIVDYSHPALAGHLTSGYDFVSSKPKDESSLDQSSSEFLDQSSSEFLDQSSSEFLDQSSSEFLDSTPFMRLNAAYSHGTLCAGIIAAMAPDSMIMPLRAFDDQGQSDVYMIAKAIRYATRHGAQIINMSFGTLHDSKALKAAIDYARRNNVLIVASAGNGDTTVPQYPASYPGVIAVSATDITDTKASFSNFGDFVALDAPGVHVISAFPGGFYGMVSGTSFSAPMVASELGLVRSMRPSTNAESAVLAGTVNIDSRNPNYAGQLGTGRMDILKTIGR